MFSGKALKDLRKKHRYTLQEIAFRSGIDRATMSRLENGWVKPVPKTVDKILDTWCSLGIPVTLDDVSTTPKTVILRRKADVCIQQQ